MNETIYNSPVPAGLNKEEIRQYKSGLQKTVEPFQKEAMNNYNLAIEKARQLSNYNSIWVKKALNQLNKYNQSPFSAGQTVSPVIFYDWSGA